MNIEVRVPMKERNGEELWTEAVTVRNHEQRDDWAILSIMVGDDSLQVAVSIQDLSLALMAVKSTRGI